MRTSEMVQRVEACTIRIRSIIENEESRVALLTFYMYV